MTSFLCKLDNRGVILVRGKDRFDFLQGLITQDIFLLKTQSVIYTAMLSPQGRYLHDFFVFADGEDFLIITTRVEELLKRLKMYKLRRDVSLELAPLHVYVESPLCHPCESRDPEHKHPWIPACAGMTFEDHRRNNTLTWILSEKTLETSFHAESTYHYHRITHGLPESDVDMLADKTFPLEAGLHELNAISFTKGCYVGQELTTRTHHRGVVRKRLLPVRIEGELTAHSITQNDNEVGDLRSTVTYNGTTLAMALLRLEAVESGDELVCGDATIIPLNQR